MLGVAHGLRELRVCRSAAVASASAQYRHFVASSSLGNPADVAPTTPEAAAAAVAAKKTGRAVYWFVGVAGAAVLGSLAYPQLVTLPPQKTAPLPPPVVPPPIIDPPPSPPAAEPPLSPREELIQRVATLRTELAEMRMQKKDPLVNMKKRAIKDEIAMIESGLKMLDKA